MKVAHFAVILAVSAAAGSPALAANAFRLTSPDLRPDEAVPSAHVNNGYGCHGQNRSPALAWEGAPAGARSFAISVFDPDASGGWWHWTAYNLPPATHGLAAGAGDAAGHGLPAGAAQGRNDFGPSGYGGPCPPLGQTHHYVFTVYALRTDKLALGPQPDGLAFSAALDGQVLAKATLTTTYGR